MAGWLLLLPLSQWILNTLMNLLYGGRNNIGSDKLLQHPLGQTGHCCYSRRKTVEPYRRWAFPPTHKLPKGYTKLKHHRLFGRKVPFYWPLPRQTNLLVFSLILQIITLNGKTLLEMVIVILNKSFSLSITCACKYILSEYQHTVKCM